MKIKASNGDGQMAEHDLVITNGLIVDGTGAPAFKGTIGVKDGRISYIGEHAISGSKTIDAAGRYVTPGFIDMHTHYDAQITWDPWVQPHTKHGVTTFICGNCGFTLAPVTKESLDYLIPMLAKVEGIPHESLIHGAKIEWNTTGEMLDYLDGKVGVNIGFMTGHSTLRAYVMGKDAVSDMITREQIDQMKLLLRKSLEEGSLGFSSSHIETHKDHEGEDVPSLHASHEELIELASIVREFEGTMAGYVHTGKELDDTAMQKMAEFSIATNRPYAWPLLTPGYTSKEFAINKMSATDYARKMGAELRVQSPSYPLRNYVNMKSGLSYDQFPGIWNWLYRNTSHELRVARFKDQSLRAQLEADALKIPVNDNAKFMSLWHTFKINTVTSEKNQKYLGRLVSEIAAEEGKTPFNALMDIVAEDDLNTIFVPVDPDRDEKALWEWVAECLRDDRTMWGGDDGGAHLDQLEGYCHGTQFLMYAVREYGFFTIEEAVHEFTQAIANYVGLKDRGTIAVGMHADLNVIDLDRLQTMPVELRADFPAGGERLYTDAEGFDYVIVNGTPIIAEGEYTGAVPGTVLRARQDTYTVDMTKHADLTRIEYLEAAE
jgi:N-acyl-D-aspartate/D-glutamate deacylase